MSYAPVSTDDLFKVYRAAIAVLDTERLHEDGCDIGKGADRHCDCALSGLAYATGWNAAREKQADE